MSVLVRSTNRTTLDRALDSVAAQTYPAVEIVLVAASGGDHPPPPDRWRGRPIRFVAWPTRLSRSAAANVALMNATGVYLNFLDDDDELLPTHLSTLVEALRAASPVPGQSMQLAYAQTRVIDSLGADVGILGERTHPLLLAQQNSFAIHAALFSRKLIADGANFDAQLDVLEDQDFFLNCATRCPFIFVPQVTSVWHAFVGDSGASYGQSANAEKVERARRRIAEKWSAEITLWGREPAGLLLLAERLAKAGQWTAARSTVARLSIVNWKDQVDRSRFLALCERLALAAPQ